MAVACFKVLPHNYLRANEEQSRKSSVRIGSLRAKIRIRDLPNTKGYLNAMSGTDYDVAKGYQQ